VFFQYYLMVVSFVFPLLCVLVQFQERRGAASCEGMSLNSKRKLEEQVEDKASPAKTKKARIIVSVTEDSKPIQEVENADNAKLALVTQEEAETAPEASLSLNQAKSRKGAEERIINSQLRIPVSEMKGLAPIIAENVTNQFGIEFFFPVQSEVIPAILRSVASAGRLDYLIFLRISLKIFFRSRLMHAPGEEDSTAGDVCVCAPTGSGKTLAYAIPIVNVCKNASFNQLSKIDL